jgi:hypothetical protein
MQQLMPKRVCNCKLYKPKLAWYDSMKNAMALLAMHSSRPCGLGRRTSKTMLGSKPSSVATVLS